MPQMNLKTERPSRFHVSGFLLLLLAVAIAGAAVYYWPVYGLRDFMVFDDARWSPAVIHKAQEQSPSQDANTWKTYTSTSFSVMYPPSYEATGDFDKSKIVVIHDASTGADNSGETVTIEFVSKAITSVRGQIGSAEDGNITSAQDVKFNGYDAREIILKSGTSILLISKNGGTYKITHKTGASADILATFKFTL
ncbi:MAG: hypothetical protein KW788_01010 [Candidatus Doudnabacteria bacterium]|nr:hypothetical protein [Candidatus Doudnabacteria bacterium]